MKRKSLILLTSLAWIVLLIDGLAAKEAEEKTDKLSEKLKSGEVVTITIVQRKIAKELYPYKEGKIWGLDNFALKRRKHLEIISSMRVFVDGKQIPIPLSAFSDLTRVNSIKLNVQGNNFTLDIDGSDTACHYTATLEFSTSNLLRRTVRHGEFRDEYYEMTLYSYPCGCD